MPPLRSTIGVLLFAGCLALSLKPQGGEQRQANESFLALLGADPNSSQLVPRILIMAGCSGSTFVQEMARKLLSQHGFEVDEGHKYELAKPSKNEVYQAEPKLGMGHAMDKLAKTAEERKHVLVFKAEPRDLTPEIVSAMKSHGARVVHAYRSNVLGAPCQDKQRILDRAVCNIRDCFADGFGYPVGANGTRSKLCFDRRWHKTTIEKAHLDKKLLHWMQARGQEENEMDQRIVDWGFLLAETLTVEDLFAFQYGASKYDTCDVACSVRAWCRFLSSWGVDVKPDVVSRFLTSGGYARDPPGPHRDTIANYEEVKALLAGTEFAGLWRD